MGAFSGNKMASSDADDKLGLSEEEELDDSKLNSEEDQNDDSDYNTSKKRKRGKKRKAKESKKSNKKKKKRKNDSDSDAEFDPEPELEPPSSKGRKSKGVKTDQNDQNNEDMPTVSEVCENFGLTDVDLEYSDADYQNLTTYKLFQQTYRQRIQAANPKVPQPKLMMLVAAKWREFQSNSQDVADDDIPEEDETPNRRNGRSSGRVRKQKVVEDYDFEEDEDDDNRRKSKSKGRSGCESSSKSAKKSSKSGNASSKKDTVPKLKIKLGGRSGRGRRGESSEEEKEDKDSDAEFEEMLKEAEGPEEVSPPHAVKDEKPKTKAKMKIGSKNKKKSKKKNFATDDTEHQEYCEVCQQGGEIILCDTCPRAYHLVCLDPELDEAPEGKWSCPI